MDPENNSTNEKTFDFHGQHMTKDLNSGHSRAEMSTRRVAFPMLKPLLSYISTESRILFLYGRVHVASALVQILYAVFGSLARAALSNGSASSRAIFLVYRNVIAAVFVAPLAFILERWGSYLTSDYHAWLSVSNVWLACIKEPEISDLGLLWDCLGHVYFFLEKQVLCKSFKWLGFLSFEG